MNPKKEVAVDKYKTKDTSMKLSLLSFFAAALILLFAVASVTATEIPVYEGELIQAAISVANPGDTIIVHNGTYTENVVVNRSNITICSANGSAVTIVVSNRTDMHVFNITDQKNVTLEGFTISDVSATLNATELNMPVNAGETTPVYTTLAEKPGAIKITSKPSGAMVLVETYLGRSRAGETPIEITDRPPGNYTIVLILRGYLEWTENVTVKAGKTVKREITLVKATGDISVTSEPSGANIYLDGRHKGETPYTITEVYPGHYTIKLTLEGYEDWTKGVDVTAGEEVEVDCEELTPILSAINVTSEPTGASIYLDASHKGETPHTITEVSWGHHTINLSLEGYLNWTTELQVKATETADVHAIMIPSSIWAGIYMDNASNCVIKNNSITNCGHGILIALGSNNTIERNKILNNSVVTTGVRLESGAINTGIYDNCFIDNQVHAWDDGLDNNWSRNYWSQPPGGPSNYIIPGTAESEDKDPRDECPLKQSA